MQSGPCPIRAGAASAVITPPLGLTIQAATHENKAVRVRDDLEVNVLFLRSGEAEVALVSCDLAAMEPDEAARLRTAAAERAGLRPDTVILCCTHTHGGPVMMPSNRYNFPDPAWHAVLQEKLTDTVARAVAAAVPARVGWAQGEAKLGYNRRLCFADGTHAMHGDVGRPDFTGLEGTVDNRHTGLFARTLDGRPLAVAYNNASHPTTFYGADCFSADWPGETRALIRRALAPDLPVLYLNGAQGDVSIENMAAPQPRCETRDQKVLRLGCLAAGETLRLYYEAVFHDAPGLSHLRSELRLPVRLPAPEKLARAREILEKADRERKTGNFEALFAHGAVLLQERFGADPADSLPIHAIRIGDLALATLPGEFYNAFGQDIRRRSPAPLTGVIGLADGNHGYVPTLQGILGGGYSGEAIHWTRFPAEAGYRVADEACRLLYQLGFAR